MSFIEDRFPKELALDYRFGARWNTEITSLNGGAEQRNQIFTYPLHEGSATYGPKQRDTMDVVRAWHMSMQGTTHSFRMWNRFDYKSCESSGTPSVTDQFLYFDDDLTTYLGDGAQTTFQIVKEYITGSLTSQFVIKKPVASTVIVSIDSVAQTEGVDYTVDTTTGIVTFGTAPALNEVPKCGYEYDLPVRFVDDYMPTQNIDQYELVTVGMVEDRL